MMVTGQVSMDNCIASEDSIPSAADAVRAEASRILDDALLLLHERGGCDFSGYRRATLERRLANRIVATGTRSGDRYLLLLRDTAGESDALAANLTVKVSRFYRNAEVFEFLAADVLPRLRQSFGGGALRAWSAGCANGEEAWTLAALLDHPGDRIVATDIDPTALESAETAVYPLDAFSEMPAGLFETALTRRDDGDYVVSDALRPRVAFSRHDLGSGAAPPEAPFHLICCRNVLIYFAPALQQRAIELLLKNLLPGGVLFLGEAEWPPSPAVDSLQVLHRKGKLFRYHPYEVRS
jgi:chemotaxis methyl-accepting protein methylase